MKKFIKKLALILLFVLPVAVFAGCDLFGDNNNDNGNGQQHVSYGTAKINYHYDYDSAIEQYYQVTYSTVIGVEYEVTEFYEPPVRTGYKFMGWTLKKGDDSTMIGDSFKITGAGFGGNVYSLYAKYEIIEYTVTYHLEADAVNGEGNPDKLTGKATLKKPTREGYNFLGWYTDAEFTDYMGNVLQMTYEMTLNGKTQMDLYPKWERVYKLTYQSNVEGIKVKGDNSFRPHYEYTADTENFNILLDKEYFKGYLFLGWTYDGQDTPVIQAEISMPNGSTGDRVFIANYLRATTGLTEGVEEVLVNVNSGLITYTVSEAVTEIVVEDISRTTYSGYDLIRYANIKYKGENEPKVTAREGVTVTFEKIAD